MLVGHGQGIGIFGDQTEVLCWPVAQAESSFIAKKIMHFAIGYPVYGELVHKEGKE